MCITGPSNTSTTLSSTSDHAHMPNNVEDLTAALSKSVDYGSKKVGRQVPEKATTLSSTSDHAHMPSNVQDLTAALSKSVDYGSKKVGRQVLEKVEKLTKEINA